jgi:hypothetical protein
LNDGKFARIVGAQPGPLAELADATDSKSVALKACGFESHEGHLVNGGIPCMFKSHSGPALKLVDRSQREDLGQGVECGAGLVEQFRVCQIAREQLIAVVMLHPLHQPFV